MLDHNKFLEENGRRIFFLYLESVLMELGIVYRGQNRGFEMRRYCRVFPGKAACNRNEDMTLRRK